MRELLVCALVLLVSLCLFLSIGSVIFKIVKQRFRLSLALIVGFFGYFALFQVFYLPSMILQVKLSTLSIIWMIFCAGISLFAVFFCGKQWIISFRLWMRSIRRHKWRTFLLLCTLVLAAFEMYYMVRYGYNGYDTQYYIGTVNTSVYTNSIFTYDPLKGMKVSILPLRYTLSGFYMNWAVFCQVFRAVPALCMRYGVGALCCILSNCILFELGRTFFHHKKTENGYWTVMFGIGLNFFFRTIYTTSEFLLVRSYEAKAFCANVVLPAILLFSIWIWIKRDHKRWWIYLGTVLAAANAVSMSSILTAPVMAVVLLSGKVLFEKKNRRIKTFLVCMIPCVLYLGIYYLEMKNVLIVRVR